MSEGPEFAYRKPLDGGRHDVRYGDRGRVETRDMVATDGGAVVDQGDQAQIALAGIVCAPLAPRPIWHAYIQPDSKVNANVRRHCGIVDERGLVGVVS